MHRKRAPGDHDTSALELAAVLFALFAQGQGCPFFARYLTDFGWAQGCSLLFAAPQKAASMLFLCQGFWQNSVFTLTGLQSFNVCKDPKNGTLV